MVDQVSADALGVPPIEPPAFYGKLPGHGDFVGRGLTGQQERAIDRWLAAWLAAARADWADDFEANYRDAQPWLFAGERLSAVAIPSADRVGRLFPLLAAARAGVPIQQLYDTVIAALTDGWDGDRLQQEMAGMAAERDHEPGTGEWFVPDSNECAMPHPLASDGAEARVVEEMLG